VLGIDKIASEDHEPGDVMEDEEPLIGDEMVGDEDDSNPMAALLASARARATIFYIFKLRYQLYRRRTVHQRVNL
jgi:hypothetical protein